MKNIILISFVAIILVSCGNSSSSENSSYIEPQCTDYEQVPGIPYDHETINGEICFRGLNKFIIWDHNVHCPFEPDYDFRTEATSVRNPSRGDRCLHCKKTWSIHRKK